MFCLGYIIHFSINYLLLKNMASATSSSKGEFIIGGKYRLVRKIGSGSFGDIYLAINIANGEVCTKFLSNIFFSKTLISFFFFLFISHKHFICL